MLRQLTSIMIAVTLIANHATAMCVHTCGAGSDSASADRDIHVCDHHIARDSHSGDSNSGIVFGVVSDEIPDCPFGHRCTISPDSTLYLQTKDEGALSNVVRVATLYGWAEPYRHPLKSTTLSIHYHRSSARVLSCQQALYQQLCRWLI